MSKEKTYIVTSIWDGMDGGQLALFNRPFIISSDNPRDAFIRAGAILLTGELQPRETEVEEETKPAIYNLIDISDDEEGLRYRLTEVPGTFKPMFEEGFNMTFYAEIDLYMQQHNIIDLNKYFI